MQFFNGIPDWNGNGQPDAGDLAMQMMIFESVFGEKDEGGGEDEDDEE